MVESRSFYNMLHVHVSLNQCHSLCKKTCMSMDIFQVQVVGEVGQETLFPKFCTHPPLFPKIFVLHRGTNAENLRSGVRAEKNLRSKVLHLFGMEFRFAILRRRNPKETKDIKESPFYFIPFEVIRNPHVSALRCKKVSAV